MGEDDRKAREDLVRFIDGHLKDLLDAPAEELLEDAKAAGLDPDDDAQRVTEAFGRAKAEVGRRRMEAAKSGMATYRTASGRPSVRRESADEARGLTLAARHGTGQSERDRQTLQDDLNELDAFEGRPKPE